MSRPGWGVWSPWTRVALLVLTGWAVGVAIVVALGGPLWVGYGIFPLSLTFSVLLWREYWTRGISLRPKAPVPRANGFWRTRLGRRLIGTAIGLPILAIFLYIQSR